MIFPALIIQLYSTPYLPCTVGYATQKTDRDTPKINLCGNWLKDAGFITGASVIVKIAHGCIVLIPDSSELTELKQQLKQVQSVLQVG
ncbi:SymE family type I addiction module toxin [Rosenbergiella epipactidis]|uniref:SymE family type I addiction module toxin n=1 Tax=Rosenbergiella epipactidis TaxID=1544694 RepID=UPI001F4E2B06